MKTSDGKEYYGIGIDLTQFHKDAQEANSTFDKIGERAERSGKRIDSAFDRAGEAIERQASRAESSLDNLQSKIGSVFAVGSLLAFEKKVIDVRSEMEAMQISFKTLAGEHVGQQLYDDIKQFAATTPLLMGDIAKGAQTLLGFNIEAEKVMPILRQIGDISMGDSQKFNSLSLAFAQMSSTGKLMGQDLLQMINAGFNPLVVIAQKTGKTVGELKEEMSQGKITVEMVEDAFRSASAEGGKFNGMLEKQGEGMKGAVAQLQGAIQNAMNGLGDLQQGVLVDGAHALTTLVENYETLGRVLLGTIATYGTYKAAVMTVTAIQAVQASGIGALTAAEAVHYGWLVLVEKAQKLLNATMLANPYVLAATLITGVCAALWTFASRSNKATEQQKQLNEAVSNFRSESAAERAEIDRLFNQLRKAKEGTQEYKDTKDKIINQYGKYLDGLSDEIRTLKDVEGAYRAVAKAAREASLARGREAALKGVEDTYGSTYSDTIGKLQSALTDKGVDKKVVTNYIKQVQKELRNTGTISSDTEKKVRNLLRGSFDYGRSGTWFKTLRDNEQYLQDAIERTDEMFQLEEEKREETTKKEQVENKKVLEDRKKSLQAELDALSKEKAAGEEGLKLKKQIADIDKDLKAYSVSSYEKSGKDAAKQLAKTSKEHKEYLDLQSEQARERSRQSFDLWAETEQAEIDAMEQGTAKSLRQIELDYARRKEELTRQAEDLRIKKYEEDKKLWEQDPKNEGKTFTGNVTDSKYDLTKKEQEHLDRQRKASEQEYTRLKAEQAKTEIEAMRDYLKEYGTYQQQKLAIAEEYAEKIRKAQSEGERMRLRKEQQRKVAEVDANRLAMDIDWSATFKGVGNVLSDIARETLQKVQEYMNTEEFKKLSPEAKKPYVDLRDKLVSEGAQEASSPFNFKIWGEVAKDVKAYQQSVRDLRDAEQAHTSAVEKRKKAEETLNKATTDAARALASDLVTAAQQEENKTAEAQQKAKENEQKAKQNLTDTTNKANQGLQNFSNAVSEIANGTLYGFANGVTKLITSIGGASKGLSELGGKVGGIVGAILQIIDALGDDPAQFIEDLLNKVAKVVEKILEDLPELIVSILTGVMNIVTGIIGGIGSWFGLDVSSIFGGSTKAFDEAIEKWGWLLDTWKDNLEYEKGLMKEAYGSKVTEIANKSEADLRRTQEAAKEVYKGWAGSGAGWFSHSNGYKANENANWSALWNYHDGEYIPRVFNKLEDLSEKLGVDVYYWRGSIEKLFDLSVDELKDLMHNNSQFWQSLDEEARKYLEQIIELEDEIVALQNEAREQLTDVSFDSVVSDFKNALSDMDSESEDFAENFEKYMQNAVINSLMLAKYKGQLEAWYKSFATAMESDNKLTEREQEDLNREYQRIVDAALAERNTLRDSFGWGEATSQDSTKKGYATASQDSIDELNGRFAGLMMIAEGTRNILETSAEDLAVLREFNAQHVSISGEIRNLAVIMVSYLEDIRKYTKVLPDMKDTLDYFKDKIN